jgi:hypothetical protein
MNPRRPPPSWLLCLVIPVFWGAISAAVPPIKEAPEGLAIRAQIAPLLRDLDSERFVVRQEAAMRLGRLAAQPEWAETVAAEFQRVLGSSGTSLEVRKQLEALLGKDAARPQPPQEHVSPEEIDRLVAQLEDNSYGVRVGAAKRLQWLLENPKMVCPILNRLKRRMDGDRLTTDARQWLEPLYNRAHALWLTGDPADCDLRPVSQDEMVRWLDELERTPEAPSRPGQPHVEPAALREFRDLMARSEYVAKAEAMLKARLEKQGLSAGAARRFQELLDLTRPAMVAECWFGARLSNTQHLIVGVPSMGPLAQRPSHFDRIDDKTAHCVSGQNLSPGDYPVGVAIPHPKQPGYFFHLVNLTTPRHKLAYGYVTQNTEKKRLADISRRTFDRLLALRRPLDPADLPVFAVLDPRELSRFAGRFFEVVDDQPLPEKARENLPTWQPVGPPGPRPAYRPGVGPPNSPGWQLSQHRCLCVLLAANGTREAAPGLLRAVAAKRFLPPTPSAPEKLEWIAALAIAQRDPWPQADAWLGSLLGNTDALVIQQEAAPQLGATAAAILLERHREEPGQFGILPGDDSRFPTVRLAGYRFASPEARDKVQRWWREHEAKAAPARPAGAGP